MATARVRTGDVVAARELPTLAGPPVRSPDPGSVVHLQFRRDAGCPICNLHLRACTITFPPPRLP